MILKSLKDSAYARRATLGLVAIGFLLDQANAYLSDEDEDGQLFYDKIPDWTHGMNAVLMLPGSSDRERADGAGLANSADTSVRLFLPYGYNVFPYIGNRLSRLERGVSNERTALGDVAVLAFNSFSPISGQDLIHTITPTIASPIVEMATNKRFTGAPIYPRYRQPGLPDAYYHTSGATQASRLIAQRVNMWTGGSYAESGLVDVSPNSIDHVAGFLTGGAGRFIGQSANLIALTLGEGEVDPQDVPLLRDMYVPPQGWWTSSLYWDRRRELEAAHNQARRYEEAGDPVPHEIRWRADLWRNSDVRLEAERLRRGTVGRRQDQASAYLLLNRAYVRAMMRNTPYSSESIFDGLAR